MPRAVSVPPHKPQKLHESRNARSTKQVLLLIKVSAYLNREVKYVVIHIKWSKVILFTLAALLAVWAVGWFFQNRGNDAAQAAINTFDEQSAEAKLLVYTFSDKIQAQSDLFYEPYYTIPPTIAYYSTYVSRIKDNGANIEITFFSLPYIGPHDTIGEDEITFQVNHTGETFPISFRHLKSHPLPENLISLQKELPPIS